MRNCRVFLFAAVAGWPFLAGAWSTAAPTEMEFIGSAESVVVGHFTGDVSVVDVSSTVTSDDGKDVVTHYKVVRMGFAVQALLEGAPVTQTLVLEVSEKALFVSPPTEVIFVVPIYRNAGPPTRRNFGIAGNLLYAAKNAGDLDALKTYIKLCRAANASISEPAQPFVRRVRGDAG